MNINYENDNTRKRILKEFDFTTQILRIYDLDKEILDLKNLSEKLTEERDSVVEKLPEEIYNLYSQLMVVDRLKGNKND